MYIIHARAIPVMDVYRCDLRVYEDTQHRPYSENDCLSGHWNLYNPDDARSPYAIAQLFAQSIYGRGAQQLTTHSDRGV